MPRERPSATSLLLAEASGGPGGLGPSLPGHRPRLRARRLRPDRPTPARQPHASRDPNPLPPGYQTDRGPLHSFTPPSLRRRAPSGFPWFPAPLAAGQEGGGETQPACRGARCPTVRAGGRIAANSRDAWLTSGQPPARPVVRPPAPPVNEKPRRAPVRVARRGRNREEAVSRRPLVSFLNDRGPGGRTTTSSRAKGGGQGISGGRERKWESPAAAGRHRGADRPSCRLR